MNSNILKKAWIRSIPVMAGYIVLGFGFGVMMHSAGFGVLWTLAMSVFVFAGSMQYVGVGLLSGGATVLMTAVTTFAVNARHLFYSISMLERYHGTGKKKPYLIFALTDETYSLLCGDDYPEGEDPSLFAFLVSLFDQCYWIFGSVLGTVMASSVRFNSNGIEFSMTALFVATFVEQWITEKRHFPAVTGIAATILCRLVFGNSIFLIPSMILIAVMLLAFRQREPEEGGGRHE